MLLSTGSLIEVRKFGVMPNTANQSANTVVSFVTIAQLATEHRWQQILPPKQSTLNFIDWTRELEN
jgi:hypothetical protein